MNLIDLINRFKKDQDFEIFCSEQSLNFDSESIQIYMQKAFDVKSDIFFFEDEVVKGLIEYKANGKIYHNLFDFYYFQDVIQDYINNYNSLGKLSSEELASILLNYAINDA